MIEVCHSALIFLGGWGFGLLVQWAWEKYGRY